MRRRARAAGQSAESFLSRKIDLAVHTDERVVRIYESSAVESVSRPLEELRKFEGKIVAVGGQINATSIYEGRVL